jgi:hypothetical protein
MEVPKDATALDVATAILLPVFARASRDILETGASTRQFSAKTDFFVAFHRLGDEVGRVRPCLQVRKRHSLMIN